MDFNHNGMIERNDAFLLARANFNMAAFIRDLHVIIPDHRDESTDCTLEISARLSARAGSMNSIGNMQVYLEFASEDRGLSEQLVSTIFDAGEVVTSYDGRFTDNFYGGIVKAKNQYGSFQIRAEHSKIEKSEVGLSIIQVMEGSLRMESIVTPLFAYSPTPRFSSALRVTLAPSVTMIVKDGHSPQLSVNFTDSYQTCHDPTISNTVIFVFENDFADVEGKEHSFIETFTSDLIAKYQWIKIENVLLTPGSIMVSFDVITQKSRMNNTLVAMWEMIKFGYTLFVNDTRYHAKVVMRLNGKDYTGNGQPKGTDEKPNFPVRVVVGVCVTVGVIAIVGVIAFGCRKRTARAKDNLKWKSVSKVNILDPRSTSRMNQSSWDHHLEDHEMELMGTFYNEVFDNFECDSSLSPFPSSRNSPSPFLKLEENFSIRRQKIHSASSQGSVEAWTRSSSPNLKGIPSPKLKIPSLFGQIKETSQDSHPSGGSPSPRTPKGVHSPLTANSFNLISSDSSEDELVKSGTSSPVNARSHSKTPMTPTSRLRSKESESEVFVFEKALLYKKLKSQERASRHSCKLSLVKAFIKFVFTLKHEITRELRQL